MTNVSIDPSYLNIPIKRVVFGGDALPLAIRECTITRSMDSHDAVELSAVLTGETLYDGKVRIPLDATDPSIGTRTVEVESLTGQTASFVYGAPPATEAFVGYATVVTPDQKFKEGVDFKVSMLGASLIMQRTEPRFEVNVTSDDIIRSRALGAGLGFSGPVQQYRWPSVGQVSETDWEICQGTARNIGMMLCTWEAVLRLVNPVDLLQQYPYTTLKSSDDILEAERTMMDFTPSETSGYTLSSQGLRFWFFDSGGVLREVATGDSDTTVWRNVTTMPVANSIEAAEWERGVNSTVRWTQTATTRVRGDAGFYPGMTVGVDSGTGDTTRRFNGRWLVLSVKHSMDRTVFQTELTLARPSSVPVVKQVQFQHFWQAEGKSRPASFVRDNLWRSSWT